MDLVKVLTCLMMIISMIKEHRFAIKIDQHSKISETIEKKRTIHSTLYSRFTHGMDDLNLFDLLKNEKERIIFDQTCSHTIDQDCHDDCIEIIANVLSIDNEKTDNDIIILDPSETRTHAMNDILNDLINKVIEQETITCQISNPLGKHSSDIVCQEIDVRTKKVRLDTVSRTQTYDSLFVSEGIVSHRPASTPIAQFLCHLALDLCLEQYPNQTYSLVDQQRQILTDFNRTFHEHQIYSCPFCSFRCDTRYVLHHHYRTPHKLIDSKHRHYRHDQYRCTYCSFRTFRLSVLSRHTARIHRCTLIRETIDRHYSCNYCSYDTDDKISYHKHITRCQIVQERTRLANNLLAPNKSCYLTKKTRTM
jgi:hypothetical protein